MTTSQHVLEFGSLTLSTGDRFSSSDSYSFEVSGEDMSMGSPMAVNEVFASLLQDGSLTATSRYDNREPGFTVTISAADGDALAEGEAALYAECSRRNELKWTPPDGFGATTVMDVLTSSLEFLFDDMEELRLRRHYRLSVVALPFGRSDTEVVTAAVTSAVTPVTTVINDCSSTANWFQKGYDGGGEGAADVGSLAGTVEGSLNPHLNGGSTDRYYSQGSLIYRPASPVDMSSTSYLYVDWDVNIYGYTTDHPDVFADGLALTVLATVTVPGTTFRRSTYFCADTSVAEIRIKGPSVMYAYGSSLNGELVVDQIVRTNQAPTTSGTLRQKVMSLEVVGSARTQGSLAIEHATSALGNVLVYTYPDDGLGYTPDLRRWKSAGPTDTTDSSMVSGKRCDWDSGVETVFTVPLRMLRPGPYLLMARFRRTAGAGTVTMSATTDGGSVSRAVTFTSSDWGLYRLGIVTVADHEVETAFTYTITATGTSGVEFDEAWLFYVGDNAHLTQVACGTGTPSASSSSNRLWIDTPSLSRPYPSIWRGTLADRSDAKSAAPVVTGWEDHSFAPPSMTVFTVTTNALDAAVSLRHYPRWHSNARRVD